MKFFLLFLVLASSQADYVVKEDEDKKEDDVVGIGLVYRPSDCGERTTRKGDLLRVYFNGSLADGSFFDTTLVNVWFVLSYFIESEFINSLTSGVDQHDLEFRFNIRSRLVTNSWSGFSSCATLLVSYKPNAWIPR